MAIKENRRSLRTVGSEVLVLLVSSFLLSIAFPGFMTDEGLGFIALLALIPVFAVIRNTSWKLVWIYGFFYGFSYYTFFNYWMKGFHALAILIVPIIKGGEMVLLFLALKAAVTFFRKRGYLLQAVIWVAYGYLSESWFAGYPYGNIAYALYDWRIIIQIADITGIWGIIFMMVLPQAFVGNYIQGIVAGSREKFRHALMDNLVPAILYAVLLVLILIYGAVSLSRWEDKQPDMTWRVAAVQHNHDSWKGGYTTYLHNFNNLRKLTLESLQENPDIVIWSETAFVPSVAWHTTYSTSSDSPYANVASMVNDFVSFANSLPVPLLTGNPEGVIKDPDLPPVAEDGTMNRKDYNTVILFDDGQIKETYRKQHLVPFTEHFPYQKTMPWLYNMLLANDYNWWEKGDEPVVFNASGVSFSTPICFEDVFGYLSAEYVGNGADVIVNMTNDSWSKTESAEMQHAAIAIYRSIETRKSTVRGTNSGISCMITPDGTMHEIMKPFEMGWHVYQVPVYTHQSNADTFYVNHIDLFAHIAIIISAASLAAGAVLCIIRAMRKKES